VIQSQMVVVKWECHSMKRVTVRRRRRIALSRECTDGMDRGNVATEDVSEIIFRLDMEKAKSRWVTFRDGTYNLMEDYCTKTHHSRIQFIIFDIRTLKMRLK
jgi:hypothetical protein